MSTGMVMAAFAAQFTPDGLGYRYRRARRGAAVWVTAAERDRFVAAYAQAIDRLWWVTVAVLIVIAAALFALVVAYDVFSSPRQVEVVFSLVFAGLVVVYTRRLNRLAAAPAAALAGRMPMASPLNPAEWRRAAIRAQPWATFLAAPVSVTTIWLAFGPRGNVFAGAAALWPVGTTLYLVVMAGYAVRKWRVERSVG